MNLLLLALFASYTGIQTVSPNAAAIDALAVRVKIAGCSERAASSCRLPTPR